MNTRREMLMMTAAGATMLGTGIAGAQTAGDGWVSPRAGGWKPGTTGAGPELRRMIVINTMGGLGNPNKRATPLHPTQADPREIADAQLSGLTIAVDYVGGPVGDERQETAFDVPIRAIARKDALCSNPANKLLKVYTAADMLRAKREQKIGVVYAMQGFSAIGDKADRADIFLDLGVRSVQFTLNARNQFGGGCLDPAETPMTPFCREVMERLQARRTIVDFSHSGRKLCLDGVRATKLPVSINHTACAALAPNPRNKPDDELRAVADTGGYVGIVFMPFLTLTRPFGSVDVADHIAHAINVCGEDHVGIGTDNTTTAVDDMAAYMQPYRTLILSRRRNGVSAPGEDPDIPRYGYDMNGPQQYEVLVQALRARGIDWRVIEKVVGANYLRFARDVWGT